ncbi:MAG: hypothetical protein, partial [Olavius algarvensis Gamma 3 endosymbiont]
CIGGALKRTRPIASSPRKPTRPGGDLEIAGKRLCTRFPLTRLC